VLGLTWDDINLDAPEVTSNWQLQRSRGQLYHRETKTPDSDATLRFPARRSEHRPGRRVDVRAPARVADQRGGTVRPDLRVLG
jgi:hypothetical protein